MISILTAILGIALAVPAAAAPRLSASAGMVFRQRENSSSLDNVAVGAVLAKGDGIRTGADSRAAIVFDDRSRVEVGPKSLFVLEEAETKAAAMRLTFGSLRAWVEKIPSRRFEVRTPTAVCAVRGTEFAIDVDARGHTGVRMFTGLMSVSDGHGREAMVKGGQSIRVTDKGLGPIQGQAARGASPSPAAAPATAAPQDSMSLIRGGGDYSGNGESGGSSSAAGDGAQGRARAVQQAEPDCRDNACCYRKCLAAGGRWRGEPWQGDSCIIADVDKMHRIGCGAYKPP
ncbi:MAG TPA: FecR family protein [Elusimicrobiota bacterium]|nr:FecR family protein [Elusimicrobiota bacterium]